MAGHVRTPHRRRAGRRVSGLIGLRFSERRGRERGLKVVIAVDDLWRFATGMIWRSYADSMPLSRACTDEYQDALARFESLVHDGPSTD